MSDANIKIKELRCKVPDSSIVLMTVSGQLDIGNLPEQVEKINATLQEHPEKLNVIMDLEDLEYLNSRSIGYITQLQEYLVAKGGQLLLVNPRDNIIDIFETVGLTQLIKIYKKVRHAKKSINDPENAPPPLDFSV